MNYRSLCLHARFMDKQSGQALPIGLAFVLFGTLLGIVLFNSGRLTSEKSQLVNTADSAVYSGLVWQARALNFQSYTNRAMVANQVSIAQFVSLATWTDYGYQTAFNINNTIGWIPPLKPFTQQAENAMRSVDEVVGEIASVAIPVLDGVNQVLSGTQQVVYVSTFAITPDLVREVVKANDSDYDVDSVYAITALGRNALAWDSFTTKYEDEESLERKADVINRSRDRFTRSRDWNFGKLYLAPVQRLALRKEGETRLLHEDGKWAWKGKDTLSIHWENWGCGRWSCGWSHNEVPIGWGSKYSQDNLDCNTDWGGQCDRWMNRNRRAEYLANSMASAVGSYSGVQAYYDLKDLSEDSKDPRLNLKIEVQVDQGDIPTANKRGYGSFQAVGDQARNNGFGAGMFRADDRPAAESMASMASGEIYFKRPDYKESFSLSFDGGEKKEYASLYNPYWSVRLTDIGNTERLAAWAVRSPELLTSVAEAASTGVVGYGRQRLDDTLALTEFGGSLEELVNNLPEYEAQIESLSSELTSVVAEADEVSDLIKDVEDGVVDMTDSALAQVKAERQALEARKQQLQSEIGSLSSIVDNVDSLAQQVTTVDDAIAQAGNAAENAAVAKLVALQQELDAAQALADQISLGNYDNILENFTSLGKEQLQSALQEQFEEKMQEVMENAATSFLNEYGGDTFTSVQSAVDELENIDDLVESEFQEAVRPLREQVDAMRDEMDGTLQALRNELDAMVDEANAEIAQLENLGDQAVDALRESFNEEIQGIRDLKAIETDPDVIEQYEDQIADLENQFAEESAELRQSYQNQVNDVIAGRDEMIDNFEAQAQEYAQELESNIQGMEDEISELRAGLNL